MSDMPADQNVDRRQFLSRVGAIAGAGALGLAAPGIVKAGLPTRHTGEAVKELHASLSDSQKKVLCLPLNHKKRSQISPNWNITEPTLGEDFYSKAQRELASRVLKSLCSEDGYKRFLKQMDDDSGGIDDYSMAFFGEPGSDGFQWEFTGRHVTLRADGDRNDRLAFGGPIVYGHGEEGKASDNLFFYQTKQVNKVFGALEGKQRQQAMIAKAPREADVRIQGDKGRFRGIQVGQLSADQKALVTDSLRVLMAPFRAEDIQEAMWVLLENGGIDKLHMAFSSEGDLQNDKTWDVWRIEGPSFVWNFRGAPHVHAYLNIGRATPKSA